MPRFRVWLPITLGIVSAGLIVWDLTMPLRHTGDPIWPFDAPLYLQRAINLPAFIIAAPFFYLPHVQTETEKYPVLLPAILLWWWWFGTRLDFGILGGRHFREPKLASFLLTCAGAALLFAGSAILIRAVSE